MSVKYLIVALLVLHTCVHAYYGEEEQRVISELTANRFPEELHTPFHYIDTMDMQDEDSDFEIRDDIPDDEAEEEDDSDYEACTKQDITDLITRVGKALNKEVDDTNADFDDLPAMMDMGDLKEKHYEMKGLDSCLKKTSGKRTTFKAKMKALQNGVGQTCEIVLVRDGGRYSLPKSQCQGQN